MAALFQPPGYRNHRGDAFAIDADARLRAVPADFLPGKLGLRFFAATHLIWRHERREIQLGNRH